jgi:hypothetical protein
VFAGRRDNEPFMIRALCLALVLGACNLVFPKPEQPAVPKPTTRPEIEEHLRAAIAEQPGDACAKAAWIGKGELVRGADTAAPELAAEIAEELRAEQAFACRKARGGGTLADSAAGRDEPEPLTWEGACTRADAEAKLRARGDRNVGRAAIEEAFAECFAARVTRCQAALDTKLEGGIACWREHPWPEAPAAVDGSELGATTLCLSELQAVASDLRACTERKKPAERDACVAPYVGYVPKCALLDASAAWSTGPWAADIERLATADAKRRADREAKLAKEKAEREARIAKERERCHGLTTVELAERLVSSPTVSKVPGCRYRVTGNVLSRNNVYVQLANHNGKVVFLLRTREAVEPATLAERTALFESVEEAELADGTTQKFAVFTLERK